jgi:alanine racemase
VRHLAPQSRLITIVKANAYGHGLLEIAHTLHDADCFGVARIDEALTLRNGGITKPILLLEGFFYASDLPVLVENNIQTVVHNIEQLGALERSELSGPITVWMKLDTGMHRLGVRTEQADAFYQRLCACRNVVQPVNIMSHFSSSGDLQGETTEKQIACFNRFASDKPGEKSIAASGGILLWPQAHLDWVRPGIILYGVSPLGTHDAAQFGLQPVMTLKSSLIAVREHKAGEPVGYDGSWVSERDTRLGVVSIGYGDGYPRSVRPGTPVWINGREVPIVGHVSMDMISVDLGPNATDRVNDEVVLWGKELPVERVAACSGISPYELITTLTPRVAMEYVGE